MKKYYKILIIAVLILCAGGGVIFQYVKASSKKSAEEHYFEPNGREYLKNMSTYSSESYDYEGYKISLDSSIFDENTNVAYCVFSIKQNDGKTDFLQDGVDKFFGENKRFSIETVLNGTIDYEQELDGDTLYYYLHYSATSQEEEYKGKLWLIDADKEEKAVPTEHVFTLVGSDSRAYKCQESEAFLSPIALSIKTKEELEINTIVLNYKDGSQEMIVEEGLLVVKGHQNRGKVSHDDGTVDCTYKYQFKKAIDISGIESISVNDLIFENVNES